jgi:TM2 domain-containing membrane protein YozV
MYSVGIAYLLWLISGCGALGFHRFYLGKIPTGLLWMFSGGLGMVGAIYDFFTLPGQVRETNIRLAIGSGKANGSFRNVTDGEVRTVREKESIERIILKTAKENDPLRPEVEPKVRRSILLALLYLRRGRSVRKFYNCVVYYHVF